MDKGNVLVIGNSGVGKSTLINAVLGEECAETSWGPEGTTRELKLYEVDGIPFRIIDTVGFEPSFLKEQRAIHAVKKWSRESAKSGHGDNGISVIWFCVDGTSRKLFPKTIKDLSKATAMWESVPVVVVITKSYSVPEREQNIEMIYSAFAKQKNYSKNLRKILPVVASPYILNETAYAPPEGISELIDITNEIMPEGVKAGAKDIAKFKLTRKRALSQTTVGAAAVAGVAVGAIPIPFSDAALLGPTEIAEINALAKIYEINRDEKSKQLLNSIIEAGTVGTAAKTALSSLKSMPGINMAASALNAIVAGVIIVLLGEASIYVFEQIYLGEKSVTDIDWVTKIIESKFKSQFAEKIKLVAGKIADKSGKHTISQIITDLIKSSSEDDDL
ncbi:MAG: GTPase [Clostridiaceae bacterium]|nr:GTPase [Clostridiaceae bacterium]